MFRKDPTECVKKAVYVREKQKKYRKKPPEGPAPQSGPKRNEQQRERDIATAGQLFCKGWSYQAIADHINERNAANGDNYTLTRMTIYKDIKGLLDEWRRDNADTAQTYIYIELQKLDIMERETWKAWEASKTGQSKEKIKRGDNNFKETTKETTAGDPRFLEIMLKIQQRRAKLLGYDAPDRLEVSQIATGKAVEADYTTAIPADILTQLADQIQDAQRAVIPAVTEVQQEPQELQELQELQE